MALNFDFADMIARVGREEFDRITTAPGTHEAPQWHPVTNAIIWATIAIDMGSITEATVQEFADRLMALQAVDGGLLHTAKGQVLITREDVQAHLGMRTNVTTKPRAHFAKRLDGWAIEAGDRKAQRQGSTAHAVVADPVAYWQAKEAAEAAPAA